MGISALLRRGIATLAPTAAVALCAAAPGLARTVPRGLDQQFESAHFVVHFTTSAVSPDATTATAAQADASLAERAFATEVGEWGFLAPADDGDGKTDIYVAKQPDGIAGQAVPDSWSPGAPGSIRIDPRRLTMEVTSHEFFHVIQFRYQPLGTTYLMEGTAEWAGTRLAGRTGKVPFQLPYISLDCTSTCSDLDSRGYFTAPFYEFLSERYGPSVIREIFERAGASTESRPGMNAVESALAAHGSTVSRAFADYTVATMNGAFSQPWLASQPVRAQQSLYTGTQTSDLGTQTINVDHLSSRFVELWPGDLLGSATSCRPAVLHLRVSLPAGTGATPFFFAQGITPEPRALTVAGAAATIDVPWTTCASRSRGLLSLPNASRMVDHAVFEIAVSVTVEGSSEPAPAPAPVSPGPASTTNGVPAIEVAGSARVAASAGRTIVVVLTLTSSTEGTLVVTSSLGTRQSFDLAAGANRIAVRLPRNTRPGAYSAILWPFSRGGVGGRTVQRTFVVTRR